MSKEVVSHQGAPVSIIGQGAQYPIAQSYTFDQVHRMAVSFANSGLFGVKDADSAFALMMYAQALGKHPAIIMMDYDLIGNRLAKKSAAMLRDFQRSGGRVEWTRYTDAGVTGIFSHPLSPIPVTVDWDIERAKKAGLASKDGGMYGKYGRSMFRSRCISEGVRTTAPDATEQMYTPEELRDIAADDAPETASITAAVTQAAEQIKTALTEEEVGDLVATLDVKTLPELTAAFGRAYTVAKGAKDQAAMKKIKANYDEMKSAIEAGTIT